MKMRRCEDEKMFYRLPLLEEPCAQTRSGKMGNMFLRHFMLYVASFVFMFMFNICSLLLMFFRRMILSHFSSKVFSHCLDRTRLGFVKGVMFFLGLGLQVVIML